jgi:hypothetical protein
MMCRGDDGAGRGGDGLTGRSDRRAAREPRQAILPIRRDVQREQQVRAQTGQGGWNTCEADTERKDHTMTEIARPNNDSLYISCLLDLRKDPIILEMPAFDSKHVSLMITGYDHYVNIPMATRLADFGEPEKMLIYSARTESFDGLAVEGVDRVFEATGVRVGGVPGHAVRKRSGAVQAYRRADENSESGHPLGVPGR